MRVALSIDEARAVFERAEEQMQYVVDLHRLVLAKASIAWEDIASTGQYFRVSRATNVRLTRLAMEADERLRVHSMVGGAWLNYGFGDGDVPDEQVEFDASLIVYKDPKIA